MFRPSTILKKQRQEEDREVLAPVDVEGPNHQHGKHPHRGEHPQPGNLLQLEILLPHQRQDFLDHLHVKSHKNYFSPADLQLFQLKRLAVKSQ